MSIRDLSRRLERLERCLRPQQPPPLPPWNPTPEERRELIASCLRRHGIFDHPRDVMEALFRIRGLPFNATLWDGYVHEPQEVWAERDRVERGVES